MFKQLLARKGEFASALVLQAVNNGLLVGWSFLFQLIVDTAMGKTPWQFVPLTLFIVGYVVVMDSVFTLDHYFSHRMKFRVTAGLREQIIAKTAAHSPAGFAALGAGKVIAKVTKQLDKVETDYYNEWLTLTRAAFQFTFAVIGTLLINPLVTLVALVLCIPALIMPLVTKKAISRASASQMQAIERYTSRITDLLGGFNTLKYALAPATLIGQHHTANQEMFEAQRHNEKINQLTTGVAIFWNDIMFLMVWVVGAMLVKRGQMGMGQLVAFSNLAGFMSWPMTQLTQSIPTIISGGKAAGVIQDFLDAPTEAEGRQAPANTDLALRADALGLTLADQPILRDVDLTLTAGKKYLVVGASGGGKSTLVRTLLGEIAPTTGQATLYGVPAATLPREAVYDRIGLMTQKGYIFAGTVRENMTLFQPGPSDDAILAAMRRAGLGDWLTTHTLETQISEAGGELSGGEKQRLALARLFLRGYDFYVFDELTTGLDPKIADQLQRDICAMPQGFLMITHTYNAEAFAKVDEIIVLAAGRIIARGPAATPAVHAALQQLAMVA